MYSTMMYLCTCACTYPACHKCKSFRPVGINTIAGRRNTEAVARQLGEVLAVRFGRMINRCKCQAFHVLQDPCAKWRVFAHLPTAPPATGQAGEKRVRLGREETYGHSKSRIKEAWQA